MSRRTLMIGAQGSITRDQRREQSWRKGARGQGLGQADQLPGNMWWGKGLWHRTWEQIVAESLSTTFRTERQQLREEKHLTKNSKT